MPQKNSMHASWWFIWSLRLRQISRMRHELGLARTVVLLPFFLYIVLKLWFFPLEHAIAGMATHTGLLLLLHFRRKDGRFLRQAGQKPAYWYLAEYLPLGILLAMPGFASTEPVLGTIPLLTTLILPWIPAYSLPRLKGLKLGKWVPPTLFEWKAGMNQRGAWVLAGWVLGLVLSGYTVSVPLFMFLLPLVMTDWYGHGQPLAFLKAYNKSGPQFLRTKLRQHLGGFNVFCLPLSLAFLLQHYEYWYVWLYAAATMNILLALYICLYYSVYAPNESASQISVLQAFAWVCTFIPFFIPVPLVMLIQRYGRAQKRLTHFLPTYA